VLSRRGLYVEEHGGGAGAPLLVIQGLGYATWASRYQTPALSRGRRVIAFDNRGAGRSLKPPGPYSIELLAEDAASVLDERGVISAHVLGHSMGGYIALALALRRPELVRSLVLVSTGAGAPAHEPVPEETMAQWLANAHLPPHEFARRTMHLSFRPGWTEEHAGLYEELLAARLEHPTPPQCWRAQFDAASRFVERGAPVERIASPALVVHGDADRVVPVSNGRALAERLPRAELVVFPGAGHLPTLEEPERFNAVVAAFLDRAEAVS